MDSNVCLLLLRVLSNFGSLQPMRRRLGRGLADEQGGTKGGIALRCVTHHQPLNVYSTSTTSRETGLSAACVRTTKQRRTASRAEMHVDWLVKTQLMSICCRSDTSRVSSLLNTGWSGRIPCWNGYACMTAHPGAGPETVGAAVSPARWRGQEGATGK